MARTHSPSSAVGRSTEVRLSSIDCIVAGGLAGASTRLVAQPLDVLKIRLQLQLEPINRGAVGRNAYRGVIDATKTIVKYEGAHAFWKGHLAAQLLSIIYGVTQFWSYEVFTSHMRKLAPKFCDRNKGVESFTCGALAGAMATFTSQPLDVIRTRLAAQRQTKGYNGIMHALKVMHQVEGTRSFYRGMLPSLVQTSPQTALYFLVYSFLQRKMDTWKLHRYISLVGERSASATTGVFYLQSLICGGVAGGSAKLIIYPFDMVKKRLQISGFEQTGAEIERVIQYRGMKHCFRNIIRHEGPLALYKGLMPGMLKAVVATAVNFLAYEAALRQLRLWKQGVASL